VLEDLRGVTSGDNWSAAPGFVVLHLTGAPCNKEQSSNQETSKALTLIDGFHDDVNGFCGGTSSDRWLRSTIIVVEHVILAEYDCRYDWLQSGPTPPVPMWGVMPTHEWLADSSHGNCHAGLST
jgi:hypothetical protein